MGYHERHTTKKHKINYVATAKSGDIVGMANKGEAPQTFAITTKEELSLWRRFNHANKTYRETAHAIAGVWPKSNEDQNLFDAASVVFSIAHQKMQKHYGGERWTKWHGRTMWVCKPND